MAKRKIDTMLLKYPAKLVKIIQTKKRAALTLFKHSTKRAKSHHNKSGEISTFVCAVHHDFDICNIYDCGGVRLQDVSKYEQFSANIFSYII